MKFRRTLLISLVFILVLTPYLHPKLAAASTNQEMVKKDEFYRAEAFEGLTSLLEWFFPSLTSIGIYAYIALKEAQEPPVSITFGGDVLMEYSLVTTMQKKGATYPFQYVKPLFEQSDYTVINLETPITNSTTAFPKLYNFKASPLLLDGLKEAGVDMVSLANNHTLDYGEQGLLDTLAALNKAEMHYIGAGKDYDEAYSEKRVTIKGKTFAFLGFSKVLPAVSWYAGKDKPGIASGYQVDRATKIVKEVSQQVDHVIVYYHWGKEKMNKANQEQKNIARLLIDHGADAVVGSHPHVLQGFDRYKGKPIAYSIGNFLFPNYVRGPSADTGVLKLTFEEDNIDMRFIPHKLVNDQITPLPLVELNKQYQYLNTLSEHVYLNKEGNLMDLLPVQKNGQ